jgi:phosphoribosylanthranilate isomerase
MALSVRIKICGVTNEADALQAARAGADALGLNFHPGSPRYVEPSRAALLLRDLPPFVEAVGVFVNRPLREAFQQAQALGRVRTVQMHGKDRELCDPYPYHLIAAFPVRDADSLQGIVRYLQMCEVRKQLPSAVLVDAYMPGQHGGTGRTAPWQLLAGLRLPVPLILAGGLTPDNVAEAIRVVRPYAVDVASGVESSPGRKDPLLVCRFIDAAREAAARL